MDEIVTQHLQRVADEMDVQMVVLTNRVVMPKYFTLGDIVIKVELFQSAPAEPDVNKPHLVVNEFCVSIVGLDGDHIISRRVGMLAIFCYESIYETLTKQGFGNFEATEVLKLLDF